jgi:amidohydrolase
MNINPQEILKQANSIKEEIISWRRHIHMYPELSGEEYNTAHFIIERLKEFGIEEIYTNVTDTPSVVAYIRGEKEGPTVGLRADIDALPIDEVRDVPYKSRIEGVMHACGHDAHTAMLLGAAKLIQKNRALLRGSVKLIFQSCEEYPPCSGARQLVEAGVCDDLDVIFGMHVYPEIESGKIGYRIGPMTAAADFFKVRLIGKSAHASKPHLGIDPVLMAAQAINSIHHIVSRKVNPLLPVVVTIGKIQGGYAANQIPDSVEFEGTVRTLDEEVRDKVARWIEKAVWGISLTYGGRFEYQYQKGYPPVINDKEAALFGAYIAKELLGKNGVVEIEEPSMGGEDFAYYLKKVKGAYFRLGTRNEKKGTIYPLHSSLFDIDEDILPIGSAFFTTLALKWTNTSA